VEHAKVSNASASMPVTNLIEVPGKGLRGTVDGRTLIAGNLSWMTDNGCSLRDEVDQADFRSLQDRGVSVVLFGLDQEIIGAIGVADTPRAEAAAVVSYLQEMGLEIWMVTGDNSRTAHAVAAQVGIKNVFADVMPGQKSEKVAELQRRGHIVAMIGDGINDSPALARADVGIAVGAGTDVAIETAEIVLMKSNLWDVATGLFLSLFSFSFFSFLFSFFSRPSPTGSHPSFPSFKAIDLSKTVFRRIRFNFCWAFGYNTIGIPIAAGVLFPVFLQPLPPYLASLAMALSSVSVVLSSLLLRLYRPPRKAQQGKALARRQQEEIALSSV